MLMMIKRFIIYNPLLARRKRFMYSTTYGEPGSEGSDLGDADLKSFSVINFSS